MRLKRLAPFTFPAAAAAAQSLLRSVLSNQELNTFQIQFQLSAELKEPEVEKRSLSLLLNICYLTS